MTKVQVQTSGGAILADCVTSDMRVRNTVSHRLSAVLIDDAGVIVVLEPAPLSIGGVAPDMSATLAEVDLAWHTNKILAIKAHRTRTGAGLRESKYAIEAGCLRLFGADTNPAR